MKSVDESGFTIYTYTYNLFKEEIGLVSNFFAIFRQPLTYGLTLNRALQ